MTLFKSRHIFIIIVSVIMLHFMLTSIAWHYIAVQVGSRAGQIVAEGIIEFSENYRYSEKNANEIYQDMKSKSDEIISDWRITILLISLPIKPAIQPLLNKIKKAWIYDPVFSKKLSKEQLKTRLMIIQYFANGLNSIMFGLLIYLAYRLIFKRRIASSQEKEGLQ